MKGVPGIVGLVAAVALVAGCSQDAAPAGPPMSAQAAQPGRTAAEPAMPAANEPAEAEVKAMAEKRSQPGKIVKSEAEWQRELTPEQYRILRQKGTEAPFTGKYTDLTEAGVYRCAACGAIIFRSDEKYHSGCGWPAFTAPADKNAVEEKSDHSHFMERTEILCSRCGGHLGHVFDDGPQPTGQRYCINSAALKFDPAGAKEEGEKEATEGKK